MAYKRWIIADADKERASELSEKFNIDPFIAFLLVSRGIDDELAVSQFLSSSVNLFEPFNLADMDKAVARIENAIDFNEKITVYGDYDCDGVTATALLVSLLSDMGADVDYYIPSRETEGYGLNMAAAEKLAQQGTKLIITVDNGISALAEAEYIYSLGMELVVTDHHQLAETLPRAEAVVNPHRNDNGNVFENLAGVGVAFKLACALYGDTDDMLFRFADLVAIGTIGDVVPLIGENRALVKAGLSLINENSRMGISALRNAAGCADKEIKSSDVAFVICPRINATGRIDSAERAVDLLICEDKEQAAFKAEQLNINNSHRQELESSIYNSVKKQLLEKPRLLLNRVIVVSGKGYHQGVVGIVASRILEEYGKPVIIIGVGNDGTATGSARSIDGFNIFEAVKACKQLLLHFGGHPKAAGLTLESENLDEFTALINEYALREYPVMPVQTLMLDFKLSPFYLNLELADALSVLEPYGECNKRAVFALIGLTLLSVASIGGGNHIRLECEKKGKRIKIVKFGMRAEDFPFKQGDRIDAAVKIDKNIYNGKVYLSVQAVDIRKNGVDYERFFEEKSLYELFLLNKNNDKSVFPSREICSLVYRVLRQNGGWQFNEEELCFNLPNVSYGQMKFALKAFEESGLIASDGGKIRLLQVSNKVDLMNTDIMTQLKGRLKID